MSRLNAKEIRASGYCRNYHKYINIFRVTLPLIPHRSLSTNSKGRHNEISLDMLNGCHGCHNDLGHPRRKFKKKYDVHGKDYYGLMEAVANSHEEN